MTWLHYEQPESVTGPGKSRPQINESTRLFRLRVTFPDKPPMTITLPAPSQGKAILYCKNRWPGCTVELRK